MAAGSDVDVSDLTLTGEGGNTYTLATSSDVEITSATEFTVAMSGDDKTNVDGLLNKNGTLSDDSTTYNLAAADDFITNVTSGNTADTTNAITVSSVSAPSITSATYDVSSGVLMVTGIQLVNFAGTSNDVDISTLTLTGESSGTHTITSSSDVEITSATSFSITLGGSDKTSVDSLLNNNGTSADDSTTYNLAAADNWLRGAAASTDIADVTNGITVSNAPENDGSLTAAAGVTEPVTLETTVDTVGEAVNVFDFTLSDGGTSDGLAMTVSQIVLNVSGTASDVDRDKITWRLNGSDASNVTGSYNAGADTITFSSLSISIADGGSEIYTVNAYYNDNTSLTESNTIILSVDGDTDLTVGISGTAMGSTSSITNGSGSTVSVTATGLAFTTQPSGSVSGNTLSTQPVVTAQDAFGNTDIHFTETVTLSESSSGTLSGDVDIAAVSGVATFTDVVYTATADQESFTLTANDEDGTGSDLSTTNANAVTSDVVATQLVFDTQPAPLNVSNGQATAFTTVPVVSARDAGNLVDTDYSTDIMLSEINGAGSATMTATGDSDGSGATVSITPSSGVSTFSALTITYTASGGSSETFNLQASSGVLSTATSSQLTGQVPDSDGSLTAAGGISEPVALNWSVDTVGEAIDLFDFTLSDGGSSDGLAMQVSQIVLNVTGTASDTDRAKITWRLNGSDASNITGTYNAGSDTITFSGLSISVADGGNETYTINGYFNDNTNLTHGHTVLLSVDGDTDLTIGSSGTQMGSTSAITNSTGTVLTDNLGPYVSSVSVPANNTYATGANLDFTVNFNENVTVNTTGGTPRIAVTVGSTTRYANYLSGSGTTALIFRHTVQSGDQDSDGVALGITIDPNSGTLQDGAGNDINTTLNSVGSLSSVLIDAVAPTVTEVTAVTTPTTDSTPNVQISSTEAGTLALGGSCGSGDEGAISSGNTTITLTQTDNSSPLASGTYSDCTAMVTDSAGNISNTLTLSSFIVDVTMPTLNTNTGKSLNEGDTGVIISNTELSASDNVSTATNLVYTLITTPSNGTLRNDGTALSTSNTFTQEDIDNNDITYDHDGSETTNDTLTFTVTDGAGNVNNNSASKLHIDLDHQSRQRCSSHQCR